MAAPRVAIAASRLSANQCPVCKQFFNIEADSTRDRFTVKWTKWDRASLVRSIDKCNGKAFDATWLRCKYRLGTRLPASAGGSTTGRVLVRQICNCLCRTKWIRTKEQRLEMRRRPPQSTKHLLLHGLFSASQAIVALLFSSEQCGHFFSVLAAFAPSSVLAAACCSKCQLREDDVSKTQ